MEAETALLQGAQASQHDRLSKTVVLGMREGTVLQLQGHETAVLCHAPEGGHAVRQVVEKQEPEVFEV